MNHIRMPHVELESDAARLSQLLPGALKGGGGSNEVLVDLLVGGPVIAMDCTNAEFMVHLYALLA